MINSENVISFWTWFKSISNDLLLNPKNSKLLKDMDTQVAKLGTYDWEIGPSNESKYYFALSPNLDPNLLRDTYQLINIAPNCKGWSFLAAKPEKKGWNGIFKMHNERGQLITINITEWEYILIEFDDATFDLEIKIPELECNEAYSYLAIDIALTNLLGEENYIKLIKNVLIVLDFTEKGKSTLIKNIRKHFESLGKISF
jgi:hypothetical protein